MSTFTCDAVPNECGGTAKPAGKRKGLFARLVTRLIEARQRQAYNEIRRHGTLLPRELEQAAWNLTERSEDSLPFVR